MNKQNMSNINIENIDVKECIKNFIDNNTDLNGIDLRKIYLGKLSYNVDEEIKIEEQQLSNKITLVYIVDRNIFEVLYMDLFKERLIQSTTYEIPSVLSFTPFIRKGLSVTELYSLSDLLGIERLTIEELKTIYIKIENVDYYEFLNMTLEELNLLFGIECDLKIKYL